MNEDTMTELAPAADSAPVEVAPAVETTPVEGGADVGVAEQDAAPVGDYGFDDAVEADGEAGAGEEPVDDAEQDAEPEVFSVEWPEDYEASEELTGMVNEVARECGVADKALGAYTARMIEVLEERGLEQLRAEDSALKAEWGRNYAANVREVKSFVGKLRAAGGLSAEDLKGFAGPKGYKVLHAMATMLGGNGAKGVEAGAVSRSDAQWAAAVMSDRSHPDNEALRDVKDPRHKEVTARWFRAQGARV